MSPNKHRFTQGYKKWDISSRKTRVFVNQAQKKSIDYVKRRKSPHTKTIDLTFFKNILYFEKYKTPPDFFKAGDTHPSLCHKDIQLLYENYVIEKSFLCQLIFFPERLYLIKAATSPLEKLSVGVGVDAIIPAWQTRAHSLTVCKAPLTARPSRLFKNGPRGVFLLHIIFLIH